jgi:hypothetical protein
MTIPAYVELRKQDVLETIQSEWTDLHALVLQSADQPTLPEGEGEWSVKDVLAHLCWGERWMAAAKTIVDLWSKQRESRKNHYEDEDNK